MKLLIAEPILQSLPKSTTPKTLAIILVGTNKASEIFVGIKQRQAEKYGVETQLFRFPEEVSDGDLREAIRQMNREPLITGIIVQLPLGEKANTDMILDAIAPHKDVDNLTNTNNFTSPMVLAVKALKDFYDLDFAGKKICVIGKGRLVGAPVARWLESQECTVFPIDETSANKDDTIRDADIIIAGSGAPKVVHAGNTRDGQVVFDCSGMDVDFDSIKNRCDAITPPKGGIGPLTVHFLLTNVLKAGS